LIAARANSTDSFILHPGEFPNHYGSSTSALQWQIYQILLHSIVYVDSAALIGQVENKRTDIFAL
jgi:hypothetical protein